MKKFYSILFLVAAFPAITIAQALDSPKMSQIMVNSLRPIVNSTDSMRKLIKDSVVTVINHPKQGAVDIDSAPAIILVFLPVFLFMIILFTVFRKIRQDKVKFSDFLIDKDYVVNMKKEDTVVATANANAATAASNAIKANAPAYVAANAVPPTPVAPAPPPVQDDTDKDKKPEQSTSRLVAFISGVTSVGLAACIAGFYFYRSFSGDTNISIGNLANVLYGLGLGVVPYGFNKIANAMKSPNQ